MSEPARISALTETGAPGSPERRHAADRRHEGSTGRRAPRRRGMAYWFGIAGRDLAIIVFSIAAIVFAVRQITPIFANQPTVAQQLTRTVPVAKAVVAPTTRDTSALARLVASPQFESDR